MAEKLVEHPLFVELVKYAGVAVNWYNGLFDGRSPLIISVVVIAALFVVRFLLSFLFDEVSPFTRTKLSFFRLARKIPYVKNLIKKETDKARGGFVKDLVRNVEGRVVRRVLPEKGLTSEAIIDSLTEFQNLEPLRKRMDAGKVTSLFPS